MRNFILFLAFFSVISCSFALETTVDGTSHKKFELPEQTVLIPVTDDSEPMEFVTVVDVLRRLNFKVVTASCGTKKGFTTMFGIKMKADIVLDNIDLASQGNLLGIVIPGGYGSGKCGDNLTLAELMKDAKSKGKVIAAICAAPVLVLQKNGIFSDGDTATCYPSMLEQLGATGDTTGSNFVTSGGNDNILTSKGPGTSMIFALGVARALLDMNPEEKDVRLAELKAEMASP